MLETRTAAGGAAPVARVEAEHAGGVAALQGHRRLGEQLADLVEGADVAGRVGTRGLADRRLVDEDHVGHLLGAGQAAEGAGRIRGLAEVPCHGGMQHILQQRGLARAGDAGHAHQALQRDLDGDIAQVVLARAFQHDARRGLVHGTRLPAGQVGHLAVAGKVLAGERAGAADIRRRAVEDDVAATLARAGAHVDQAVGGQHHGGIVLHHHQRVAGIAQALHGFDDAVQVARVQADAGLVEHEQRLHQRGAQRRGQVDALHLAAGQRAALAIQRQVAQAHVAQVLQARAHLGQQQLERVVQHQARQRQFIEEPADALDRHQHQVVHGEAGQRFELRAVPVHAARQEALRGSAHGVGAGLAAQAPQQCFGLQARAAAGLARCVAAVLRQQHANMHLVRFRLQVVEEALDAVPMRIPLAVPIGRAVDDPGALGRGQAGPCHVARDAGLGRVAHQVVLALLPRRRLHRLDGAAAQGLALVRDHQAEIDADDAPEAAAGFAGAVGGVEGEQRGLRIGVADIAFRAVQPGGEAPHLRLGCIVAGIGHIDVDPAGAALERGLDGLQYPHLLGIAQAEAVGHDVEHLARAGGRRHHALRLHARVAADGQPLLDLGVGGGFGQLYREGHHQARIAVRGLRGTRLQLGVDGLRRIVPHRLRGLAVEQPRRARVEQLQVIVELRHGADRGTRAAHRVGLVDGDGRRHAVDPVHLRPVHAVEELARIGAEGLDIAPLPLGIQRIEHQARLARARGPGHHGHFAGVQVQVEVLEIVLTGSADADDAG